MSDAAVDFDAKVEAHLLAQLGEVGDFVEREGEELLAAEAGIDAHHEHMVHHGKDFDQGLDRGGGVDDDAGLHAVVGDLLEGAVQVAADLLVDGHHVGAGFGEGGDEVVGVLDHQVAVEGEFGDGAEGLDHGRAEGDVGDEVAVHDVDVDDGAAAALGRCDFVGQVGEVGGEDGECQFDHLGVAPACKSISGGEARSGCLRLAMLLAVVSLLVSGEAVFSGAHIDLLKRNDARVSRS